MSGDVLTGLDEELRKRETVQKVCRSINQCTQSQQELVTFMVEHNDYAQVIEALEDPRVETKAFLKMYQATLTSRIMEAQKEGYEFSDDFSIQEIAEIVDAIEKTK